MGIIPKIRVKESIPIIIIGIIIIISIIYMISYFQILENKYNDRKEKTRKCWRDFENN